MSLLSRPQHLELCFIPCHSPDTISGQTEIELNKSEAGVNQASDLGGPANSHYSVLNRIVDQRGEKKRVSDKELFFLGGIKET